LNKITGRIEGKKETEIPEKKLVGAEIIVRKSVIRKN
jgi:hypothetical protein